MKSKLFRQLCLILYSYIDRMGEIALLKALFVTFVVFGLAASLNDNLSNFLDASLHPELHRRTAEEFLNSALNAILFLLAPVLFLIFNKHVYLSLYRTSLLPSYNRAMHLLHCILFGIFSGLFYLWCDSIGLSFLRLYSIVFLFFTCFTLLTLSDRIFYSLHNQAIFIIISFFLIRILSSKLTPFFQWYLLADQNYYLLFYVTGTLAYCYNAYRTNRYYHKMAELGIPSKITYTLENDSEMDSHKPNQLDLLWEKIRWFNRSNLSDLARLDKSKQEERRKLWKSGNELYSPWETILYPTMFIGILKTLIDSRTASSSTFPVLAFNLFFLLTVFLSVSKANQWSERLNISPSEILKPISKKDTLHDFYFGFLKDLTLILAGYILVNLLLLIWIGFLIEQFLYFLFLIGSLIYTQGFFIWNVSQSKKEKEPSDAVFSGILISPVYFMYFPYPFQSVELHSPVFYFFFSCFLFLTGHLFYRNAYKHWQNMEWGAKG